MKWTDIDAKCRELDMSHGEFCRRAGISESAMNKGLRRDSKLSPAVRRIAAEVLSAAAAGAAA